MSTLTADSVAAPLGDSAPVAARPVVEVRPGHKHLWVLLAITVLGFALRFSFPERPLLWGDDAYTIYRTHADYRSMLDILQYDGFTPLHYELYWLLGQVRTEDQPATAHGPAVKLSTAFTPTVVRFLPALWGSLMPPAIYFLAVQLVRRRTALVAALIAACSAYLLGYSRDGKMYMMLWSFTALSTACLLWWFRTGTRVAWLSWVAASLAMCSAHMTGPAMLPFQAIFFLTRSRVQWKQSILFALGLAVILAGPLAYDRQFNRWFQENNEDYGFDVEGLGWVVKYNEGRTGSDLVRYTAPAYLFSWEWPKAVSESLIAPWLLNSLKIATVAFLLLAAVGAMPWSKRLRGLGPDTEQDACPVAPSPGDEAPQPWWRLYLWLGLWIVLPVYFVYCRSMVDFVLPRAWWDTASAVLAGPQWAVKGGAVNPWFWAWIAVAATIVGAMVFALPRFRRGMVWLLPVLAGMALVLCVLRRGAPAEMPQGAREWVLYASGILHQWWDCVTEPIVATALLVVLPGLLLYYCERTWSRRLVRLGQFAIVSAILILACIGIYHLAQEQFHERLLKVLKNGGVTEISKASPAQLEKARAVLARPGGDWQTIFMPRYFGFVWIAFCITMAALYMRLPTRGLRIAAVVLLVGVNLAQFGGRLFAGSEPPLDGVARDLWRFDSHNPARDVTGKAYINDAFPGDPVLGGAGHPGCGTLEGQQGKYYLGVARGYWIHPAEWKRVSASRYFDIFSSGGRGRGGLDYGQIVNDLKNSPKITRLIVWEKFTDPKPERANAVIDPIEKAGWKKVSVQDYTVRFHWEWKELYTYRRFEFTRGG